MSEKLLTIGMATYDDYDGVFFSIQSLRINNEICRTNEVEFVVLDGKPSGEHGKNCKKFLETAVRGKYVENEGNVSSFNKYKIADHANSKYVLIIDCHVLLEPNAIKNLLDYFEKNPDCKNLVQGPLWYDDLKHISTHFDPVWRDSMYGIWATNKELYDKGEPFEIPMQGMGLLALEKKAWKGINPNFKGFGGEEGYIAEKFRQWGGKNICLPGLKWNHRFGRPNGVKYPLILEDRIWNYFIGWLELTKDPNHKMITDIKEHFKTKIPPDNLDKLLSKARETMGV